MGENGADGRDLEYFYKYGSAVLETLREAIDWVFGFVSAQAQTAMGMCLRQSPAKTQKSSLRSATSLLSMR